MDKYTKYVPSEKYDIKKGQIGLVWLGQAGFLILASDGKKIMLDPYASDSCEKIIGEEYKRLSCFPIDVDSLTCDALLLTHHHEDHYDMDYVPMLAKKCKPQIYASISAAKLCERDGIDMSTVTKVARGEEFAIGNIKARGVYADHGEMAPDALGFVLDIDGFIVYITGDTGFTMDKIKAAVPETPDLLIEPINGAYGNLNEEQAVDFLIEMGAKKAVPCHFGMFRMHEGNPQKFANAAEAKKVADRVQFMNPGRIAIL